MCVGYVGHLLTMRMRIMPTKSLGCCPSALVPMSPTMPMAIPAARPLKPPARPAATARHERLCTHGIIVRMRVRCAELVRGWTVAACCIIIRCHRRALDRASTPHSRCSSLFLPSPTRPLPLTGAKIDVPVFFRQSPARSCTSSSFFRRAAAGQRGRSRPVCRGRAAHIAHGQGVQHGDSR